MAFVLYSIKWASKMLSRCLILSTPWIFDLVVYSLANSMEASGLVRTQFGCSRRTTNFGSRLNPLTRPSAVLQTNATISESIQIHFSNLQKLIQKKTESIPAVETTSSITTTGTGRTVEFLEQFNLGKILWETKPEDQMSSPVNLNHLKRLLSNSSPQYSPRNNIGKRWREYHGSDHWTGLLDPLDENLRREVVRYGEFVQAAYHAFNYHPATTTYESDITLPDKSYKVTKNLYATSSITMPKWIDDVAPDLGWMTQRSSWIGYVAVCDDEREIVRMGRRDIVIVLRGTSTCLEWAENFRDFLVELPATAKPPNKVKVKVKVECGFKSLYTTPGAEPNSPSLSESIVNEVKRLIQLYKGENLSISITGHSLGAALALLAADELSSISTTSDPPIAVFSFGGPRVGNKGFANRIVNNGVKVLRVVNSQDVITRVPGILFNETLDQKLRENRSLQQILHDNMPWAYSHVGSELRLDTKMSPYLKPNADVACCHDLEAYLHLVDGFLASNCPFRANAKRSLVTLLSQQGSNVKKLYKNNVQAKTLNPKEGCISEVTSSVTG